MDRFASLRSAEAPKTRWLRLITFPDGLPLRGTFAFVLTFASLREFLAVPSS
jgi:hypothetical protein